MLDLGAVVARVIVEDVEFQRMIARDIALMRDFGAQAGGATGGTVKLDESLAAVAASASRASTALGQGTRSAAQIAAADQRAALAADKHAVASDRLAVIMGDISGMTTRQQRAVLGLVGAEERLAEVTAADTASFRQMIAAQSAAIGADERLTAAQNAAAASAERQGAAVAGAGAASRTAAAATGGAMAGLLKTAGQLGLIVGVLATVKAGLDISHEATAFQSAMVKIQTQAGASAGEIRGFSGQILDLAGPTAQAPEDLATSLYHVYSATKTLGYTGPQMLNAVKIAAQGATASGADLEETTNALTATMVSGLGSVNNMGAAMGALNAIVGAGDMKLSDLNEALGTGILAAAKVFGVSLSQAGAALAVFGDNNIRGADAATKLRMVIQDLSKPAAHADDVLGALGLSAASLRADLEEGGLSQALHSLKTHLDAAGVTGSKVGGLIEDAFTKKAGVGLAVLLNNMEQYDQKQVQITKGAGNFGAAWTATTQTARYALDRLWTSLEAGGIVLAGKLTPAIATSATWLGTSLPHALGVLADILGPTVHLVGVAFVAAWHAAIAVLGPVAGALGSVGHFLSEHKTLATAVATAVLAMWATYKGVLIAEAALRTLNGALLTLQLRSMMAGEGTMMLSARTVKLGTTMAAVGLIVAGFTMHQQEQARQTALNQASIEGFTEALKADSGALGDNVRAQAVKQLSDQGAYQSALRLGISQTTLTDALMGNKPALDVVRAAMISNGYASDANHEAMMRLAQTLNGLGFTLQAAGVKFDDMTLASDKGYQALQKLPGVLYTITAVQAVAQAGWKGLAAAYRTQGGQVILATQIMVDNIMANQKGAAAAKDLTSNIKDVADALGMTVEQAKAYATMGGFLVESDGKTAGSTDQVAAAVLRVSNAYATASQTGGDFLKALSTFASTAGGSEDRAAMIAATLAAANGDALNFATAMNAAATAEKGFSDAVAKAAKDAGKSVASYTDSVVNLSKGTIDYNNAAAAPLIEAMNSEQKAALATASAVFQHSVATSKDSDTVRAGKRAADDAYNVYVSKTRGMFIDSQGHLTAQAKSMGLNQTQAKKLADQYFGMPKDVKTLIEQEGADPLITVLNKIGQQLAYLTGHPWKSVMTGDSSNAKKAADEAHAKWVASAAGIARLRPELSVITGPALAGIIAIENHLAGLHDKTITINTKYGTSTVNQYGDVNPGAASGGGLRPGFTPVGEGGWEGAYTDSAGRTTIIPHAAAMAMTGIPDRFPGFGITSSSAQASVPVSRPVSVSAPVTPGWDTSRLERRLEAIEEAVRSGPREFAGAAVAGYDRAGQVQADRLRDAMRGM